MKHTPKWRNEMLPLLITKLSTMMLFRIIDVTPINNNTTFEYGTRIKKVKN